MFNTFTHAVRESVARRRGPLSNGSPAVSRESGGRQEQEAVVSVVFSVDDGIADITLDRPERHNAMTPQMYRDLGDAFAAVRSDPAIRVAIVRGSEPTAFCAGADLIDSAPGLTRGEFDISAWDDAHQKNSDVFKPVIAAVDGYCLGGGLEIMLGTDIRIAARTAVFGLPEPGVGLVPAGGTLVRLIRQIPYACAMDLLLTGRRLTAAQALSFGLISRVVEPAELLTTTREVATALSRLSQRSLHVIKMAVTRLSDLPPSAAFRAEAAYGGLAFRSADAAEGLAAFAEGRPPVFPSTEKPGAPS
ncbi:enoyl-CoA hydratase/isomerase family protein [Streptomyces sp. NPDC000134]|uniref:enoyl-CoA hydratase/isomerase family protein n=1 Tax=Streptomyces sp. NPDC000134 TaxID=3364536 RepID=UPI0036A10372